MRELRLALIVDDSQVTRILLREMLGAIGVQVIQAADGEEGLDQIRRRRPDLVISDLIMPRLDGFALATAVAEMDPAERPVLFFASAVYDHARWHRQRTDGAEPDEYLRKPIETGELKAAIGRHFTCLSGGGERSG